MAKFWKSPPFWITIATLVVLFIWYRRTKAGLREFDRHDHEHDLSKVDESLGKGCSALDPVLDPAYNMKNIAMQSVLLEEHLCDAKKRCPSCCAKHFMHIIGLAQEAVTLAGERVPDFPLLEDSNKYYTILFEQWKADKKGVETIRKVCAGLRKRRNEITKNYVLDA
jgi:hypothetical protein